MAVAAGLAALAGRGLLSLAGAYEAVGTRGLPNLGHFLRLSRLR